MPTFDTMTFLAKGDVSLSGPRRLPGLQRDATDPLAWRHDVAQRFRHPGLGREIRLERQLADERKVMIRTRGLRLCVYSAKPILAIGLRHRSEVITDRVPELLQAIDDALLIGRFAAVGEQQVDNGANARRLGARR